MKLLLLIIVVLAVVAVGGYFLLNKPMNNDASLSPSPSETPNPTPTPATSAEKLPDMVKAVIVTARGSIELELNGKVAPKTVANFVKLAREKFYDGLTFHRVEPGFVIQGGDPLSRTLPAGDPKLGTGGPGYTVPAEISLTHKKGAIAMARTSDQVNPKRDSSGSQFYIALDALPMLDGAYTVFGYVTKGMDVALATKNGDVIKSTTIK